MDEYNSLDLKIVETRNYQSIDWQPMDTAPKDGRRILLRCLDGDFPDRAAHKSVSIGSWRTIEVFLTFTDGWWDDQSYWLDPDGWLPLPPV